MFLFNAYRRATPVTLTPRAPSPGANDSIRE